MLGVYWFFGYGPALEPLTAFGFSAAPHMINTDRVASVALIPELSEWFRGRR